MYDTKKKFTWRKLNPDKKQTRLFFIVSEDMFALVHDIVPSYRTDHSGIILNSNFGKMNVEEDTRNLTI